MHWVKFVSNKLTDNEEDKIVKVYRQMDRQKEKQMDTGQKWSEKIAWALLQPYIILHHLMI